MSFSKLPVLIFGATGGVGSALARNIVSKGGAVHLIGRNKSALEDLSSQLGGAKYSLCDVMADGSIEAAVQESIAGQEKGHEKIAGLAYCVGSITLTPFSRTTTKQFMETFQLNTLGAVRAIQSAEKSLKQAQGSVVLFSTVAMEHGFTNHSVISTAKGGVEGLTKSLAAEFAPQVRVNAIAPSLVRSKMGNTIAASESMAKAIGDMHPMKRLGTPDDVANVASFLLSQEASWITGQVYHVDGGRGAIHLK